VQENIQLTKVNYSKLNKLQSLKAENPQPITEICYVTNGLIAIAQGKKLEIWQHTTKLFYLEEAETITNLLNLGRTKSDDSWLVYVVGKQLKKLSLLKK